MKSGKGKILVTGADGFIGSHLAEHLVEKGFDVRAFVFYNSFGSWGWLDGVDRRITGSMEIAAGDIRDYDCVRKAVRGVDVVFHLAALISIPYSYQAPQSFVDTNVKGTLNVVQAAREEGLSRVVHTSTSEVYGSALYVPIDEKHPLQPQSPYSASKTGADQIALSYYYAFDVPVTVLRPFNTYGPRQSARAVIPTIITQVLSGRESIRLGNLETTRDFNFVADIVSAFAAVAASERTVGEVLNAGTGQDLPIRALAEKIFELTGKKVSIIRDEERVRPDKSEVLKLCAGNTKILELTDWRPDFVGVKGLERGLEKTIEWFRSNGSKWDF